MLDETESVFDSIERWKKSPVHSDPEIMDRYDSALEAGRKMESNKDKIMEEINHIFNRYNQST
jgi:hypothetical protein